MRILILTRRNLLRSIADTSSGFRRRARTASIIVLGVDPGTLVTGYGVVCRNASGIQYIACGAIKNGSDSSMPLRLKRIHTGLCEVIERYHPDEFAIESAFYGKNAQSALKLGHARGVSILAAVSAEIPTTEYSPREIKKAVVGNGGASKQQVQFMVKSLLGLSNSRMLLDASDALAIAVCHVHRIATPTSKYSDWSSYIAANPHRVRQ